MAKGLQRPEADALLFVPLGGSGEIGMNLSLYGHAGKWLMVDLGLTFGDENTPGIDLIMADPAFIRERRRDLVGLVLTHGHEDHLGAVPYLWPELECPVYAVPFTAALLRAKLHEHGLGGRLKVTEVPLSGRFQAGPFEIEMLGITHSIPEAHSVVIRTPAGTAVHTGDWKLDPEPQIGRVTDQAAFVRVGLEGVDALVGDSTNATVPGLSGSEAGVRAGLLDLIGRIDTRVAVTCFATNVARLHSIAVAAAAHDRRVALVGRSLWRIYDAARTCGYLTDIPEFLSEHDAGYLPRNKVALICTGSQGEPRSALARIAGGDHPQVSLESGDVVVFSSREIPGNEKAIGAVQNRLLTRGLRVVTADQEPVHVSGHPARDELVQMLRWLQPRVAVPVHGERRHQEAHADLARACQVPEIVIPTNGTVVRLAPGPAEIIDHVPTGRLVLDGKRLVPLESDALRGRHRVIWNGAVVATVVLNGRGEMCSAPKLAVLGLVDETRDQDHDLMLDVIDAVREAVAAIPKAARLDDEKVVKAVKSAIRRSFNRSHGKKPQTEVHLIRV